MVQLETRWDDIETLLRDILKEQQLTNTLLRDLVERANMTNSRLEGLRKLKPEQVPEVIESAHPK